jgi:Tol biopolymer transport system component
LFVRDLKMGTTALVSVNNAGTGAGNGRSGNNPVAADFALSSNGRFLAFFSAASDLVTNDTNGLDDVFVRDLQTGTTTLVSINQSGTQSASGYSTLPSISANGRFVAFQSSANDLVAADTNGAADIFVRDMQSATTVLASVNRTGTNSGNKVSFLSPASASPAISASGRFVAFSSQAADLVAVDTNSGAPTLDAQGDVFVRDLQTETTTLVSVNLDGTDSGDNGSGYPAISADGRFVVFGSVASDLVAADTNGIQDLFARPVLQ